MFYIYIIPPCHKNTPSWFRKDAPSAAISMLKNFYVFLSILDPSHRGITNVMHISIYHKICTWRTFICINMDFYDVHLYMIADDTSSMSMRKHLQGFFKFWIFRLTYIFGWSSVNFVSLTLITSSMYIMYRATGLIRIVDWEMRTST